MVYIDYFFSEKNLVPNPRKRVAAVSFFCALSAIALIGGALSLSVLQGHNLAHLQFLSKLTQGGAIVLTSIGGIFFLIGMIALRVICTKKAQKNSLILSRAMPLPRTERKEGQLSYDLDLIKIEEAPSPKQRLRPLCKVRLTTSSKLKGAFNFFNQSKGNIECVFSDAPSQWNRDHQIVRPDCTNLRPKKIPKGKLRLYDELAHKLYPGLFSGQGILAGTEIMLSSVPSQKESDTLCCIEGGNVKYVRQGERTIALVGVTSVFFSMISMVVHGFMTEEKIKENSQTINEEMLAPFLKATENNREQARLLASQWDLTLSQMALELQVDRKNLIILEHSSLHIDLELLIGPNNTIFLHDPELAHSAVEKIHTTFATQDYKQQELQYQVKLQQSSVYKNNKRILEGEGFTVVGIPGHYSILSNQNGGHFFNGLLFQDYCNEKLILFTTAINSCSGNGETLMQSFLGIANMHQIAESFFDTMANNNISVVFVNCRDVLDGGVHCLTKEERNDWSSFPPESIPMSFGDFPAFFETHLEVTYEISESLYPLTICAKDNIVEAKENMSLFSNKKKHISVFTMLVPLEGLFYNFYINQKAIKEDDRRVLPGQIQIINLGNLDL